MIQNTYVESGILKNNIRIGEFLIKIRTHNKRSNFVASRILKKTLRKESLANMISTKMVEPFQ